MNPKILVIGDLMVDHYIIGTSDRLSPEAPVPVIKKNSEHFILGGAANVYNNLISLGVNATLCGVVGEHHAERFSGLILQDKLRKTTVKTRIMIGDKQITRLDDEDNEPINDTVLRRLQGMLRNELPEFDIVILSDYAKGLLTPTFCQWVIQRSRCVIIDPKGDNYKKYKGAFLIKPNMNELMQVSGEVTLIKGTKKIAKYAKHIIVTLSELGIYYNGNIIPTDVNHVFDVTGAGDTVTAVMAYFIAMGLSITEACEYANRAASITIQKLGASTVTLNELYGKN